MEINSIFDGCNIQTISLDSFDYMKLSLEFLCWLSSKSLVFITLFKNYQLLLIVLLPLSQVQLLNLILTLKIKKISNIFQQMMLFFILRKVKI